MNKKARFWDTQPLLILQPLFIAFWNKFSKIAKESQNISNISENAQEKICYTFCDTYEALIRSLQDKIVLGTWKIKSRIWILIWLEVLNAWIKNSLLSAKKLVC